jgi:hypothetical protein
MSMLHSFYCWGHAGVVLISTLFFYVAGIGNWKILAFIWALIPIANAFAFARVPIAPLIEDGGSTLVGMVSGVLGDNLKMGVLAGIIFPVLLLVGIVLCGRQKEGKF